MRARLQARRADLHWEEKLPPCPALSSLHHVRAASESQRGQESGGHRQNETRAMGLRTRRQNRPCLGGEPRKTVLGSGVVSWLPADGWKGRLPGNGPGGSVGIGQSPPGAQATGRPDGGRAESEKAAAGSPLQAPCLATTSWKQSSEDVRKEQLGTKSVRGDMRSRLASSHTCN